MSRDVERRVLQSVTCCRAAERGCGRCCRESAYSILLILCVHGQALPGQAIDAGRGYPVVFGPGAAPRRREDTIHRFVVVSV